MSHILIALLISSFAVNLLFPNLAFATDVRTAAQESYPKFYKSSNGKMQGLEMDIMGAIEKIAPDIRFVGDNDDTIRVVPWKRVQSMLVQNQLDIIFGIADNAKRRTKGMMFFSTPLYKINYVFATTVDDNINISSLKDIEALKLKGKILALSGSASASALKKQNANLIIDAQAPTVKTNLEKLINKRGRFFYYHDLGILSSIKKERLQSQIKILPISLKSSNHKAAYSKQLPKEVVDKISKALQTLSENGELVKIYQKYTQ